jgi:hypothetical protein
MNFVPLNIAFSTVNLVQKKRKNRKIDFLLWKEDKTKQNKSSQK